MNIDEFRATAETMTLSEYGKRHQWKGLAAYQQLRVVRVTTYLNNKFRIFHLRYGGAMVKIEGGHEDWNVMQNPERNRRIVEAYLYHHLKAA